MVPAWSLILGLTSKTIYSRNLLFSPPSEGLSSRAPPSVHVILSKCHPKSSFLACARGTSSPRALLQKRISEAKLLAVNPDREAGSSTWPDSKSDDPRKADSDLDVEFEDELEVDGAASSGDSDESEIDEELEAIKRSLGPEFKKDLEVVEGDWDEDELDELFEEFGETIVQSEDSVDGPASSIPGSGTPTDEDSEELALALASAANDTKAGNIRVLDVRPLVYWTQYFIIATAFSRPQMDAMAKRMSDLAEEKFGRSLRAPERQAPGPWTLLDYGDVVVHLFAPKERERYAIEEFYANATELELPFVQTEPNYS